VAETGYARVRVGALIAAGLAILCFAILMIGHGAELFTRTEILQAHFERINGLQTGAPVSLSGVRIGAVESITFPALPENGYVVVRIWIEQSAAERVRTDSIMQIHSMGLLGDKFVALTPGTASAPPATPDTVLASINPIDYEAILQREGTDDLIENIMAISASMRAILTSIENGRGLVSELVRGEDANQPKDRLTLESIQRTLDHVDKLSVALELTMDRVNKGQGLIGAMLSNETNGKQFLDNVSDTTAKIRQTSARLDGLIARFDKANGIIPQLMENKDFSDDVLPNLRQSSHDLKDILQKINSSRGTVGLMINDRRFYNQLTGFMDNSGGWGIRLVNGLYDLTHPLASPLPSTGAQPVMLTASQAGACIAQPAPATISAAIPAIAEPASGVANTSSSK
jgi:phospholipid/cholesterol/gamma-HCH transport system substrate-binding protein